MDCGAHIGNNTLLFSKLVGKQGLVKKRVMERNCFCSYWISYILRY